jgi:hypothetical protein
VAEQNIDIVIRARELTQQAFQKVEAELKKLETQIGGTGTAAAKTVPLFAGAGGLAPAMQTTASNVGLLARGMGLLAGAFTVTRIIDWVRDSLALGSSLKNLSQMTRINTTDLQIFKVAGRDAGVELEAIATAANLLSDRLGSRERGAVFAVGALGLSIDKLIAAGPAQAMRDIARAVDQITEPTMRAALAKDLFGRNWAAILNVARAYDQVKDSVTTMSQAQVDELAKAESAWGRWIDFLKTRVAQAVAKEIENLRGLDRGLAQMRASLSGENVVNLTRPTAMIRGMSNELQRLSAANRAATAAQKEQSEETANSLTPTNLLRNALNSLRTQSLTPLTALQKEYIRELKIRGGSEAEAATVTKASTAAVHAYWQQLEKGEQAQKKSAAATEQLTRKQREWEASIRDLMAGMGPYIQAMTSVTNRTDEIRNVLDGLTKEGLIPARNAIHSTQGALLEFNAAMGLAPAPIGKTREEMEQLVTASGGLGKQLREVLLDIPDLIASAFTGGGGLLGAIKAIGSRIGATLGAAIGSAFGSMGTAIGQAAGSMMGPAIDAIIAGFKSGASRIHRAISGFVVGGPIGAFVNALFGKTKGRLLDEQASKDVQALVAEFVKAQGGIEKVRIAAQLLGIDIEGAFGHKGRKGLQMLQADMDEFTRRQHLLQSAMDEFGFTWEDLGQKARQAKLTELGQELIDKYNALTGAGINVTRVTENMAGAMNGFVASALRTGTEIPEAMRPMIERMIELGLLTDADGNKITSLEKSGIKFAQTFTAGVDRIIEAFEELPRRIAIAMGRGVDAALDHLARLPDQIDIPVNLGVRDVPEAQNGLVGFFGRGGLVRTHGHEAVIPLDRPASGVPDWVFNRIASMHGGGVGPTVVHVHTHLDGREVAETVVPLMPQVLGRYGLRH